jgi:hypothetical protein
VCTAEQAEQARLPQAKPPLATTTTIIIEQQQQQQQRQQQQQQQQQQRLTQAHQQARVGGWVQGWKQHPHEG